MPLPPESLLVIDAPWLSPTPRPLVDRSENPKPDPEQVALQSAIVNAFDCRPAEPFEHAAISAVITGAMNVPAAASLKLIIDAVDAAGFIRGDRRPVLAARLTKVAMSVNSLETVNVSVLERGADDPTFIREMWPHPASEPVSPVVGKATGYSYVTGRPGAISFSRQETTSPDAYAAKLRQSLHTIRERDSIFVADRWADSLSAGLGINVRVPMTGNFDPDNVLLYALDLLEIARQEATATEGCHIDQLATQVAVFRSIEPGIQVHAFKCDVLAEEQGLPYFRNEGDGILTRWPQGEKEDDLA